MDEYLRVAPGVFCPTLEISPAMPARPWRCCGIRHRADRGGLSAVELPSEAMQQAEAAAWNIFAQLSGLPRMAWRRFKPSALGEFIALGSMDAAGVVEAGQMANLLPPALPPVP